MLAVVINLWLNWGMNAIQQAIGILGLEGIGALYSPPISAQAVHKWKAAPEVPIERCPAIEFATGGAVTRRNLRPNDWWLIWPELVTEEFPAPHGDRPKEAA